MQLNPNGFFVTVFLGLNKWDRKPETICALGRAIIWAALKWIALGVTVLGMVSLYLYGLFTWVMIFFTDVTFVDVFPRDGEGGVNAIAAGISAFITILAAVISGIVAFESAKDHGVFDDWFVYAKPPSKVTQFASGLYKRFKDKTCVIIEYTDDKS